MVEIKVDDKIYEVYGKNEDSSNKNPHIIDKETNKVPQNQKNIVRKYLENLGSLTNIDLNTHWHINQVIKLSKSIFNLEKKENNSCNKKKDAITILPIKAQDIIEAENLFKADPVYSAEEYAIKNVIGNYPYNIELPIVLMKISLIDFTNSTNLFMQRNKCNIKDIAESIIEIKNFDKRIKNGEPELVEILVNRIKDKTGINLFSFVTKYCFYHNYFHPDNKNKRADYSIYDYILKEYLPLYSNIKKIEIENWRNNVNYISYHNLIGEILDKNNINFDSYPNRRELFDRFIWYLNKGKLRNNQQNEKKK